MSVASRRVALVTGAARGIGRAIARRLAGEGFTLAINCVSPGPGAAEALQEEITAAGGQAMIIRADVSVAAERERLIAEIRQRLGRLDFLVNNAGVAPKQRANLLEAGEESFDRLIAVNLKGAHFLTQLAAKYMIELRTSGIVQTPRICFITSISAYTVSTNRGDYCISKAGLSMAAQLWAAELAEQGIPVVEVRPGVIATDMTAGVKEKYDKLIADGLLPQKRWGKPEDVAAAVSAIGRGDFDYSTGVAIDVSGGFQIKRL